MLHTERGLTWAVGIPRTQKVYSLEVGPTWPVAPRGRPRQRPVPDIRTVPAYEMLGLQRWRTVTWRRYQGPAQSLVRGGAGARRGRHPDPRWRTVAPAPPR